MRESGETMLKSLPSSLKKLEADTVQHPLAIITPFTNRGGSGCK